LRMAGIVVKKQEKMSQKGNKFAFMQVSDTQGVFEVTMFSDLLSATREILIPGTPILLSCDVDKKGEGDYRFLAQSIEPLTNAVQNVTRQVNICVARKEAVKNIKAVLDKVKIGKIRISLIVNHSPDTEVIMEIPNHCDINEKVISEIRQIDGVADIAEM